MSNAKKTKLILVLLLTLLASIFMTVVMNVKNDVFASSDIKTVSDVTYTMETGASIYTNDKDDRMGIRFGAYMSESDYLALRNNVGTGKAYNSIMFGVIIAPASYEDTYKFDKMNLFGIDDNGNQTDGAKYDWAIWNGTSWEYSGNKTQVINIEQTRPQVIDGKVSVIGAITTIKASSLLTNFKGVAYIIAEKQDGTFDVKFATENDNVRNTVYVAQRTYQANLTKKGTLDPVNDALEISRLENENIALAKNYITDAVKAIEVSYSVEHYYKKPVGDGYFLFETTTGTGTIDAELTAENKGSTDVPGVTFDGDNKNNCSDPVIYAQDKSVVKVYYDVVYGEDADTNEKVFDISETENYAINDNRIKAVYSSDMALLSNEGVIDNTSIVAMGKGERDLYVLTENGFEKYSSIMATHVIETGDEFVSLIDSYSGRRESESNSSADWYVVLANDLNMTGKTFANEKGTSDYFCGVFNGLGHVISNVSIKGNQGLFGYTYNGSIIKNFALTNVVAGAKYILSGQIEGALSNVYIQGSCSVNDTRGPFKLCSLSKISNVVINVSPAHAGMILDRENTSASADGITNTYVIGANNYAATVAWSGGSIVADATHAPEGSKVYVDTSAFADDSNVIDDITNVENGWSKYWEETIFGLYFGNALVAPNQDVVITEVKETKYLNVVEIGTNGAVSGTKSHEIDLKSILGSTPEIIMVDGVRVSVDDTITLNSADYEYGKEYTILVASDDTVIAQPFVFATHVISTANEFVTFFNSYTGTSTNNGTDTWYAIIANNIDMSKATLTLTAKRYTGDPNPCYYYGTFDGLGHTVSNLNVPGGYNAHGLFGGVGQTAVLKNFAFVNVSAGQANIISAYFAGDMYNVYIQGTQNDYASRGIMILQNNATVNNCVFNLSGTIVNALKVETGTINDTYVVAPSTCKFSNISSETRNVYESMSDLLNNSDLLDEISDTDNNWNEYWENSAFGLRFGKVLIAPKESVTPTEVKDVKYLNVVEITAEGQAVTETRSHDIGLKIMLGKSPEHVFIDGVEVQAKDVITLNSGDYAYGTKHSIIFGAGDTVIEQPFMFATHVISNEDEFVTFIDSYSGGNFDPSKSNGTQTWYAILTKDLDMTGKTLTKNKSASDYYSGTFDGLGHYIDNLSFVSTHGLFGYTSKGSVLKNFAIININASNKWLLSGLISGAVENIYMHGVYEMSNIDRGPLRLDTNNATLKNVVLSVRTKTPAICLESCSTASSRIASTCYVTSIRAYAGIVGWTTSINGYCNEEYKPTGAQMHKPTSDSWNPSNATLLLSNATFIADISAGATNGWCEYWNLTGDATNGYTLKFGNALVGTTVANAQ